MKPKKKKPEPRKSKWSNQKKRILPSDAEKQRAERARARPIMRRKKKNPEYSFRRREEWWEGKKKKSEARPWEWGRESEGYSRFQRGWAWESLLSESEAWDDRWEWRWGWRLNWERERVWVKVRELGFFFYIWVGYGYLWEKVKEWLGLFSHRPPPTEPPLTAPSRPSQSSTAGVRCSDRQRFPSTESTRYDERWWVSPTDENQTAPHRTAFFFLWTAYIHICICMCVCFNGIEKGLRRRGRERESGDWSEGRRKINWG